MAVEIYIETESSDSYLFVMEGQPNESEVELFIKDKMGDEFEYICYFKITANYPLNVKLELPRRMW